MKILVPLNDREFLLNYVHAGADEFYFGFFDEKWSERFGKYADINRMSGFGRMANKYSFNEILDIIVEIKNRDKSAFLTLNSNRYSEEEKEYISKNYFPKLKSVGLDAVIVSNLGLAKLAFDNGINAVASTMCGIYNSDIADVYIKSGIKRLIIPRDIGINEIINMCSSNTNIEYEVFFMRNGCVFSDCYCLGLHRPECGSTCGFVRTRDKQIHANYMDFNSQHDINVNDYLYNCIFHKDACGMCALYRLKKAGVGSLKIVGRADQRESVESDIILTRRNLDILEGCSTEEEYLGKMAFPNGSIDKCRYGFSCYYPEVRFN